MSQPIKPSQANIAIIVVLCLIFALVCSYTMVAVQASSINERTDNHIQIAVSHAEQIQEAKLYALSSLQTKALESVMGDVNTKLALIDSKLDARAEGQSKSSHSINNVNIQSNGGVTHE